MRITVDRSISSNGVPAAAPPKGADSRALLARYRSADSARIPRLLTSERVQTPSSPTAAGGRPKRQPAQHFSSTRGELETRQLNGKTTDKAWSRRRGRPSGPPTAYRPSKGVGNEDSSAWQRNGKGTVTPSGSPFGAPGGLTGRRHDPPCPGWTTEGGEAAPAVPHSLAAAPGTAGPTALDYESGVGNEVHLHGNTTDKGMVNAVGVASRGPRRPTGRRHDPPRPGWTTEGGEAALAAPRFSATAPGAAGLVVLDYESGAGNEVSPVCQHNR